MFLLNEFIIKRSWLAYILVVCMFNSYAQTDCNITLKTTIEGFKVYKHNTSGYILYKAKMAIDADGSPRAYGPNNSGLDYTANAGHAGNWWGVVTNSNGNPIIQGNNDPYPGMYVSTTSLVNNAYSSANPLHYVNSEAIPFFVLPSAVTSLANIHLGDIGYVYNTTNGQGCYAIFADGGPAGSLGEGSIYLANQIGVNSNARSGGTSQGIIDYIVFPGSGSGQGVVKTIAEIDSIGQYRIAQAGGTQLVNCLDFNSCGVPLNLSANSITSTSVSLNWASVNNTNSYNIRYKKSSVSAWTTINSTTTTQTITGLSANTSYDFQVQAVCSSAGAYSATTSFTTVSGNSNNVANDDCNNAETLTPNTICIQTNGDIAGATASGLAKASCDVYSGSALLHDVWYKFVATATAHTINVSPSSGFDAVLALYTNCSGNQIGCSDNGGGSGGVETINATALTIGTTYYIRVYSYGGTVPSTTSFNICVKEPPAQSCGTPSGLTANSITASTASLSWASVPGASSYAVHYKATSSSSWLSATSSNAGISINNLTPLTQYEFQVQAICNINGSFSSSAYFTTNSVTQNSGSSDTTIIIGNGNSSYSAHPFGTIYMDEKTQYIITKQELINAGWTSSATYLKSCALNVLSAASQTMTNFTINISHISQNSFSSNSFIQGTDATDVFSGTITAASGWNSIDFDTPFAYNGTNNLLISICWNNSRFTSNSSVESYSYSNYLALYYRADVQNGDVCNNTTGTRSYYRPNLKLSFSSSFSGIAPHNNNGLKESIPEEPIAFTNDVLLYPNPVEENTILNGQFLLSNNTSITDLSRPVIHIFDISGRQVYRDNLSLQNNFFTVPLDKQSLSKGTYLFFIEYDGLRFNKTIIIK